MGTYVFSETFLGRMANVQTAEIDSDGKGNTFFQTAGDGLHGTPHGLRKIGWWVSEEGTTSRLYARGEQSRQESGFYPRALDRVTSSFKDIGELDTR
jgi:hypothetical protein